MNDYTGISASPGLCLGPALQIERRYASSGRTVGEPGREAALFEAAALLAKDEISTLVSGAARDEGDIFLFQREILNDHGLLAEVLRGIEAGCGAAAAVEHAAGLYADKLRRIPDEYISQRAGDVLDACRRVVAILDGRPRGDIKLTEPSILLADELLPSDLASVDKSLILGIAMSAGSTQSHCAIIARTYGIPTIVAAGTALLSVESGTPCVMDAAAGVLIAEPDEVTVARFSHRINLSRRKTMAAEQLRLAPCVTQDGIAVSLLANCSAPEDICAAMALGAEGVGLLRSEFLFLDGSVPGEEEQFAFYRDCLAAANGKPVTIRTLDIGADKSVSGISAAEEENPALGLRGLRLSLAHPALLRCQLAALLRAAQYGDLRIMFPMVTTPDDLDRALAIVAQVRAELALRGVEFASQVPIGCMIETPAAALMAEELAQKCDFFSVGTNDLTQYTLAADRLNTAVANYFNPTAPALQKLLAMTIHAAQQAGIELSVCGEAAADPACALTYVRLGVRKLSMAAIAVSDVKLTLNDASVLSAFSANGSR